MFDVIVLAAGSSSRLKQDKLMLRVGDDTVIYRTLKAFSKVEGLNKLILVTKPQNFSAFSDLSKEFNLTLIEGGDSRTASVANALPLVSSPYVLIHDGARPFVSRKLIDTVLFSTVSFGSAIPALPLSDTVKEVNDSKIVKTLDRNKIFSIQTPQGFDTSKIKKAYQSLDSNEVFTDDSAVFEKYIEAPHVVEGDPFNKKITNPSDILGINAKVGTGFDVHPLALNRKLVLCGVEIPSKSGLLGHSDADVAVHAIMDAMLSAIGESDIGEFFPDSDDKYLGISSISLLSEVLKLVKAKNLTILSVAVTIIAQKPKLSPFRSEFISSLSKALNIKEDKIGVGFTTTENLGIIGEEKAIAASSIVSLI